MNVEDELRDRVTDEEWALACARVRAQYPPARGLGSWPIWLQLWLGHRPLRGKHSQAYPIAIRSEGDQSRDSV
jgi:hypothetical protein